MATATKKAAAKKPAAKKAPAKAPAKGKAKPKDPPKSDDAGGTTLEYKEPTNRYSDRQRFPYEQAVEMMSEEPGKWVSLRQGPAGRMDQFRSRFQKKVEPLEGFRLDMKSEKIEGQDDKKYDDSTIEVFARFVEDND